MAGNVSISGQITQTVTGTQQIGPITIAPNASNQYQSTAYTFSSGNTTLTVPSWAVGVLIQPSSSNAVQLTYKGASTDTGTPMSLTNPFLMTYNTSDLPSTFVINAASTLSTTTQVTFF
jgi:hypothetical protein